MSQPQPRKRRTWSDFGDIRRVPSEYEIVTHNLNFTAREGRASAFESNPTSPANMWFLTYRDRSPLQVEDWNNFRDPDELTYRKYVNIQDDQQTVVDGILDEFDKVNHDAKLSPRWAQALATVFTPGRFPAHAIQMTQTYLAAIAPSSYIINCGAFAAADMLRRVSTLAYRTRQLQLAHPEAGFASSERQTWETNASWQPTRRALETALVAYDWAECLVAANLVIRPTLDEVLLHQFGLIAKANGDELTWLLLSNLAMDSARNARWSVALAKYAISNRPENAAVIQRWVKRWETRADQAAEGLATLLAEMPENGQDAALTIEAAKAAREKVLAEAGVLAPV